MSSLEEVIACPYDHGSLTRGEGGYRCGRCAKLYPITQDVVNFLAHDDAFRQLSYEIPWHPVPSDSAVTRVVSRFRAGPIYPRLLVTSDYFSFSLEREIYRSCRLAGSMLDIGCREGTNLLYCRHSQRGIGVDVDLKAVSFANEISPANCHAVLASGTRLPLADAGFDLVLCIDVIEHILDYPLLIEEIARTSHSGARLILSTPSGDVAPNPYELHHKHFTAREIHELLRADFTDVEVRSIVRNCDVRKHYWHFREKFPKSKLIAVPINALTNLAYWAKGYQKPDAFQRADVTDATLIVMATRRASALRVSGSTRSR